MNILVDIILDSGPLRKSLRDFYYIANRISEDSRKRISEDGKYRTTEDSFYIGDIIDDFQVTENLPDIFYGVQQTDPVTLLLANGDNNIDNTWDEIIAAEEVRGKRVLIRREDLSIVGSGKITDYIIGDETSLSVELRDDEIFDTLLPQQLVTAAEFTTTALNIGAPVPILPGYCKNVPLANIQNNLVDDHYDYLIGYGTVESLWIDHNNNRGVKRNGVLVAASEYTFYDGSQASPYSGYSFIRFVKEQMDFSGGFYMLSADVKGLEIGGASAERNFANVIKALIENTTWGLGNSVNSASFTTAATALSTTYWMCDGAITKQVKARDILDQLLFSARSSLKRNSDGEWEITVDGTQSSIASFGENDGYYDNCEIESVGITPSISAIKKAIVHYDLNDLPYTDIEGTSVLGQKEITLDVNTTFGVDRTFELPFVIENTTAKKILSYIYGRAKYADKKVTFKADSDAKDLYCGNVITITSTPRNLSSVDYKVISISKRLTEYILECEKYDSRIFDDQSITDPTAWSGSPSAHGLQIIKFGTVGGWTVDENTLANGANIALDATNKKIYINSGVFGNQGIQIDYNAGTPRFYVGDGSTKFLKFDGTDTSGNFSDVVNMAAQGGCKVYQSSKQSLPHATVTVVNFHVESWDTQNEFNLATDRLTLSDDAKLAISATIISDIVAWAAGDDWDVRVSKNGFDLGVGFSETTDAARTRIMSSIVAAFDDGDENDYYTIGVYHNRGSATDTYGQSTLCWASFQKIA